MKNLKFYSILGLSALLVLSACKKEEPTAGSPVLTLSQTTLTVPADGGAVSVAYQVENPVDGASVSVDLGSVAWITDVDITDSTIDFTVEANSVTSSRTATITVSYPGAEDATLTVAQEAVEVHYDYEHTLEDFVGYLYEEYGYNYEDLYYIWLSDIGFDDGSTQVGGHYYNFALLVEEAPGMTLPTGTYTYTAGFSGNMVFSGYYSRYLEQGSSGYTESYLTDGYINVSADGDTYTIEGVVTDEDGASHRVYYNGPAVVKSFSMTDTEFTATTATATYYSHSGNVMNVDVMFTDMDYDGTYLYPPGTYVTLDTYMPYDENGKITPGTYEVNYSGQAYSIYPYYYSYAYNYETSSDYTNGNIMSGTMTIVAGSQDDYYDISCEFTTDTDATVKCTYSGYLVVDGMPGPDSSLTGDYTLDLVGAVATAYDFGDWYGNGGKNWYMYLDPGSGAGDGLILDFNSTSGDTIPTETYTASTTTTPAIGEYLYGYTYLGYAGSWYIQYDESGSVANQAPALEGDIEFTNNGDGTHTLEFACKDDLGYTWSGTWTGTINTISLYSASATSSGMRPAISKLSKQEMSTKSMEMKAAKETKVKVASPDTSRAASKTLELKK